MILFIFLLLLTTTIVDGTIFKLPLSKSIHINQNPCDSFINLNKSSLIWNETRMAPWYLKNNSNVYNNTLITMSIEKIYKMKVPGIPNTFEEAFTLFQNFDCLLYIHGGSIRDLILQLSPKDIDIEYSCSAEKMYTICVKKYGNSSCHYNQTTKYFKINYFNSESIDELEGVNWNISMFAPSYVKEYTTNTLAYDLNGNKAIIDINGNGVHDTCSRLIRIPTNNWEEWLLESKYGQNNGLKKIPRFWKLRSDPKNFSSYNNETLEFVKESVIKYWNNETKNMKKVFQKFYCKLNGGKYFIKNKTCCVWFQQKSDLVKKIHNYIIALKKDMGLNWFDIYDKDFTIISKCELKSPGKIKFFLIILFSVLGLLICAILICYFKRKKIKEEEIKLINAS